jgi:prenyltransferase beta subunit
MKKPATVHGRYLTTLPLTYEFFFMLIKIHFCVPLQRQGTDGGFQGRPNKSTDTCYAFW